MTIIDPSFTWLGNAPDGDQMLTNIAAAGRVCYQSESKSDNAAFVRKRIGQGHESILEHEKISVRIICDRGVSHELVRHRIASYSQESTRYCVAGSMKLSTANPHQKYTVSDLYRNKVNSKNGSWKRLKIRQYNDDTGLLEYGLVEDVFENGTKRCVKITTRLGYSLICTGDHQILTDSGDYKEANELCVGDKISVNGTDKLYTNAEWLRNQIITLNKTYAQVAREFGYNTSTLKKWGKKHGLPKKGGGYFNIGRIPWNKGVTDERQVNALRQYHHCGRRKDKILKEDTCQYRKRNTGVCAICGKTDGVEVHHIDENRSNNLPSNLITLCESCHQRVHSRNLQTIYQDEIVSIEDAGEQIVYDISMASEHHNFVANGIVVHNCNYSKGKFGSELTFIRPYWDDRSIRAEMIRLRACWQEACLNAEWSYKKMIDAGCTPEAARAVLPNCLKTEIVMTANLREWRHFFKLRCAPAAHPDMRIIANMLLTAFKDVVPVVFDDIEGGQQHEEV